MIMNGASRSVPLSQGEMTLGRGQDCDVSIASPFVSRLHARLCTEGAVTAIIDANSLNGLFVNGVRVRHDILRSGDVISLAGRFDVWFVAAAR